MRYPDGGGLTPQARAKRVCLQAAELFAAGVTAALVAKCQWPVRRHRVVEVREWLGAIAAAFCFLLGAGAAAPGWSL